MPCETCATWNGAICQRCKLERRTLQKLAWRRKSTAPRSNQSKQAAIVVANHLNHLPWQPASAEYTAAELVCVWQAIRQGQRAVDGEDLSLLRFTAPFARRTREILAAPPAEQTAQPLVTWKGNAAHKYGAVAYTRPKLVFDKFAEFGAILSPTHANARGIATADEMSRLLAHRETVVRHLLEAVRGTGALPAVDNPCAICGFGVNPGARTALARKFPALEESLRATSCWLCASMHYTAQLRLPRLNQAARLLDLLDRSPAAAEAARTLEDLRAWNLGGEGVRSTGNVHTRRFGDHNSQCQVFAFEAVVSDNPLHPTLKGRCTVERLRANLQSHPALGDMFADWKSQQAARADKRFSSFCNQVWKASLRPHRRRHPLWNSRLTRLNRTVVDGFDCIARY